MEAGSYKYPFSFTLPTNVPSSFEGQQGYVRYTAKATMDRPWKFDHVTRCAFTVISVLDLNLEQPQFKVASSIMLYCTASLVLNSAITQMKICSKGYYC